MATTPHPDSAARTGRLARRRPAWLVILLCWLIVVFDGYDLIVYGTTIPPLLKEPGWRLTPASAGFIGSLAFAGMLVGALGAGYLGERPDRGVRLAPAAVRGLDDHDVRRADRRLRRGAHRPLAPAGTRLALDVCRRRPRRARPPPAVPGLPAGVAHLAAHPR